MTDHGAKLSRRKQEAIAALLSQRNIQEAARVAGIGTQTLYRWMKDPEFDAVYREARRIVYRQALARLQQASPIMVTVLLKVLFDPDAPNSARLQAADSVLRYAKEVSELEEVGARLAALKHGREALQTERPGKDEAALPATARGSAPMAGHGAKFPRKQEAAIVALLTQRNVAEAARVTGIGTQTLYRWLKDPGFKTAYREARLAAFAQADPRLQQALGTAVTTLLNIAADPRTKAGTRVRAANLVLHHARDASEDDIEAGLAELGGAPRARFAVSPGGGWRPFNKIAHGRPKVAA
jgi:transposase-like protein